MQKRNRPLLLVGALSLLALTGTIAQVSQSRPGRGQEWLSWSPDERSVFIGAYLQGYLMGKTDACIAAGELFEQHKPVHDLEETPDRRCFRHAKSYSRTSADYASVITDFYLKHREYENIPVDYFMLLFTDDRYKTVGDIEQGIAKGEVRTIF